MSNRFLLEPDYKSFTSNEQLKFNTLNYHTSGCFILLILIFSLGMTINIVSAFVERVRLDRAYASEGQEIDVFATNCQMQQGRGNRYPVITYHYWVDNISYQGRVSYNDRDCSQYSPDVTLTALYLPSNPQVSRVMDDSRIPEPILFYLFIPPMLLVCIAFSVDSSMRLQKYRRDKHRYQRLIQNGILLNGELLPEDGQEGKIQTADVHVTYRFQTPDGRTLIGKQHKLRKNLRYADLPKAGMPVSVLYADDDAHVML